MKRFNDPTTIRSTQMLFIAIVTGLILLFSFNTTRAQNNLSITFRPSANFPVTDLGKFEINNGGGFETTISYRFISHFQAYGGWSWNSFNELAASNVLSLQFVETGYTFGFQFIHPFAAESKLNYIISAGGIYNHIETENGEGDIINDTGHGLGWQAETGISIPIGHHDRWTLIPGFRYRALSREITKEEVKSTIDLNYFSVGLGVTWKLWESK